MPDATDIYKADSTKKAFEKAGIKFDVTAVPLGQADMTPQAQHIVATNPDGVVSIIGHDAFCIPALNALKAVGFQGAITTISYCITDAMRKAVPGSVVKGVRFGAEAPFGDMSRPLDAAVRGHPRQVREGQGARRRPAGAHSVPARRGNRRRRKKLQGDATAASVIAAIKSMKNTVLPASGGRVFRCNGKASPAGPAVCAVSTITASLDANGMPTDYGGATTSRSPADRLTVRPVSCRRRATR